MTPQNKKIQKLLDVAKMYYEQKMTQNEIAERLGVSRPLVSKMLDEARELGIVTVQVHDVRAGATTVLNQLRTRYNLRGGVIVADSTNENTTNQQIAASILDYVLHISPAPGDIGIGWGYIIGMFIKHTETAEVTKKLDATVFPLIGNSQVPNRDYHSNEIVRIFAEKTGATPVYIHAPAFLETEQEKLEFIEAVSFRRVERAWIDMDTAIVNLGNHPSAPDYATATRFGDLLTVKKAVGRMLTSYFDLQGMMIRSESDYTIQIPITRLARCRNVIAVGSVALQPKALVGALRTGLITHVITAESVARSAMEIR